jgi:hypothetical protein
MSLETTSRSGPLDFIAFCAACAIGYALRTYLPHTTWAVFVSTLVAYHVFLGWLLLTAEHDTGLSFHWLTTIVTHAACMGTVVAIIILRRYIPFFWVFGMGISALALFEKRWLFAAEGKKKEDPKRPVVSVPAPATTQEAGDEYHEWQQYLAQSRIASKPGVSLKNEYEKWRIARAQSRRTSSSTITSQVGS